MISKNEIKLIRSLDRKKKRDEHGQFVVEGEKMVLEAVRCGAPIQKLFCTDRLDEWRSGSRGWTVEQVSARDMEQISGLATPPGVIALVRIPAAKLLPSKLAGKCVLALDAIRDPGNLGTIIRSADWFGVNEILASHDTVDCYNSKVVQSTMGSLFRVNIYYVDLVDVLRELKTLDPGSVIHGATLDGEPSQILQNVQKGVVVIGNESVGIGEEVLGCCDKRVTIPRIGKAESLNAGVSASILLYEWRVTPRS